jgi:hypothetical protein
VLPPLYELMKPASAPPLSSTQLGLLATAARMTIPPPALGPSTTLPSASLPPVPAFADLVAPQAAMTDLTNRLNHVRDELNQGLDRILGEVRNGFTELGTRFDTMVGDELTLSHTQYGAHLQTVRENSARFAEAVSAAEAAARLRPETGLEAIARAYEQWLAGGGLAMVLGELTRQFQQTPPTAGGSIPGQIVGEAVDRPRASIEIEDVVIDITTPTPVPGTGAPPLSDAQVDELFDRFEYRIHEREQRGHQAAPGDR